MGQRHERAIAESLHQGAQHPSDELRLFDDHLIDGDGRVLRTGIYGRDVAEKVHRRLRELGGVTPPKEFVFMDRAAVGLGGVFLHMGAKINWHRLYHELIDDFDARKLAARQAQALKSAGLAPL